MSSEIPDAVERALASHDAFDREKDGYTLETTVFDTDITVDEAEGKRDGEFTVTVFLPTLEAAVADETVPSVVEDGWFETLERRLADTFSVAQTGTHEPIRLERDAEEVRVILEYLAWDGAAGVDDAKTLIEYVEGTFAQGMIPGYEYHGPAGALLNRATQQGAEAAADDGTPL